MGHSKEVLHINCSTGSAPDEDRHQEGQGCGLPEIWWAPLLQVRTPCIHPAPPFPPCLLGPQATHPFPCAMYTAGYPHPPAPCPHIQARTPGPLPMSSSIPDPLRLHALSPRLSPCRPRAQAASSSCRPSSKDHGTPGTLLVVRPAATLHGGSPHPNSFGPAVQRCSSSGDPCPSPHHHHYHLPPPQYPTSYRRPRSDVPCGWDQPQ